MWTGRHVTQGAYALWARLYDASTRQPLEDPLELTSLTGHLPLELAYNSEHGDFLVVWRDFDRVRVRRIDASMGTALGSLLYVDDEDDGSQFYRYYEVEVASSQMVRASVNSEALLPAEDGPVIGED